VVSLSPLPLYPREKSSRYPLHRRLGGPESRSGCYGEEKNLLPPTGIEPQFPDRPAGSLVTVPTEFRPFRLTQAKWGCTLLDFSTADTRTWRWAYRHAPTRHIHTYTLLSALFYEPFSIQNTRRRRAWRVGNPLEGSGPGLIEVFVPALGGTEGPHYSRRFDHDSNRAFPELKYRKWLCLPPAFTLVPWRWRRFLPPKRRLTSTELHGDISSVLMWCCIVLWVGVATDGSRLLRDGRNSLNIKRTVIYDQSKIVHC
jgi:hypothetical protein